MGDLGVVGVSAWCGAGGYDGWEILIEGDVVVVVWQQRVMMIVDDVVAALQRCVIRVDEWIRWRVWRQLWHYDGGQ